MTEIATTEQAYAAVTTALALDHVARSRTDVAAVDAGPRGGNGAANVIGSACCVFMNVGDGYQELLGGGVCPAVVHKVGLVTIGIPVARGVTEPTAHGTSSAGVRTRSRPPQTALVADALARG